ncbi:MAG: hydroxymethylpyrimidine/phosphomethylpyrimidine kinase [Bacteroidota bacterium]|jgi:hydroxymethylpyrimidine/phosphomethylpyrimidine kinase
MYKRQNHFRAIAITIAGFDPSGGAGVLADIKTFENMKVYGLAVNTGITIQNDFHFEHVFWQKEMEIKAGMRILSRRFPVKAAKLGIHENLESVYNSINNLKLFWPDVKIVWDPVLSSSCGYDFHIDLAKADLDKILNSIDLITPNEFEFEALGIKESDYPCALLKKGGHSSGKYAIDDLFIHGKKKKSFKSLRKNGIQKHGSGCVLSSAITSGLAQGESLTQSVANAKKYINRFLVSNKTLSGYHKN